MAVARQLEPDRFRAGRHRQRVVRDGPLPGECDRLGGRVESRHALANERDAVLLIKTVGSKRNPLFGRSAGEVILGEIRPIVWRVGIVATTVMRPS
ncbi:MAG: hypothetical protein AUF76_19125 [Acidobacteria bacterium 13_1_20CM_2_65_9]|nr:MAG: hypothetical protein AUF76_19125 [Acidobacteria bacterium 13_1_20CM_2_65_9]